MKYLLLVVLGLINFSSMDGNCKDLKSFFLDGVAKDYVIDKHYACNGEIISIPNRSTLIFKSEGRISNCTIIGSGIRVITSARLFISDTVVLNGDWNAKIAYSNWFGFKSDCILDKSGPYLRGIDNYQSFRNLLCFKGVHIRTGCYYFATAGFIVKLNTKIIGNESIFKWINHNANTPFLHLGEINYKGYPGWNIKNITLSDFIIVGGKIEASIKTEALNGISIKNGKAIVINNVKSK